MSATPGHCLAIETASRVGSVAVSRGDTLLEERSLPQGRRHNVELMQGIADLCRMQRITPHDLAEVYVSLGPGGFTGLRVGLATAKMLALTLGLRVVGVPTLDGVAQNADLENDNPPPRLAVCINHKADLAWSAIYHRRDAPGPGGLWYDAVTEPALLTLPDLLADQPRPITLLSERLPDPLDDLADDGVYVMGEGYATPRARFTWAVGRAMAARGEFADPATLTPLYAREPEAVRLWQRRHGDDV